MCGITGILHFNKEKTIDKFILTSMTEALRHRGPDGEGYYISNNIGLGHRRLSIIDLESGDQPMLDKEHDLALVFNGEIYNYLELKSQLIKLGHKFKTKSDTEVILKSYLEWGVDCLKHFIGCWAFSLWDNQKERMFIARDRLGEKPLFYTSWNESFLFSSEMKSFFQIGFPRNYRTELIELYLFLANIPGPYTFYRDINKLLPGHYMVIHGRDIRVRKYWDIPQIDEKDLKKDKKEIYREFEDILTDSVKIQMRSDVPYGALLSGGLDSSSIVALMSKISQHKVETFSVGVPDKSFNESDIAQITAKRFNTSFNLHYLEPIQFEDTLNNLSTIFDEPFGDASAIPAGEISKFASRKVKMVLTGDGGDEVLSGYTAYLGLKYIAFINLIPDPIYALFQSLIDWSSGLTNNNIRYKLNGIGKFLKTSKYSYEKRTIEKMALAEYSIIKKLTEPIKDKISIEDYLHDFFRGCAFKDDFYKVMYYHHKHSLPDDYLVKVDRMTMANSLEARIPFLDYRLVELMTTVDKSVKQQRFERKSVLRKTIGKILPNEVLKAPKKGFEVPLREWFKDDVVVKNIKNIMREQAIFNEKIFNGIVDSNQLGEKDYGNFIWTTLMLAKNIDEKYAIANYGHY
ncbi:MAG: asparagine synthase (glutamine-hydrolyzing) [Cyclobacteriaceae bacterium]|nr:asparagine synthase (glutamine-hydrolyzing) [Cyclobacteriaceae bacterium]